MWGQGNQPSVSVKSSQMRIARYVVLSLSDWSDCEDEKFNRLSAEGNVYDLCWLIRLRGKDSRRVYANW